MLDTRQVGTVEANGNFRLELEDGEVVHATRVVVAAGIMLVLAGLGFWHARRVPPSKEILTRQRSEVPEPTS